MKKNIFTTIIVFCAIHIIAQNKSKSASCDLSKLFYDLPIDSCIEYIEKQIANTTSNVIIKKGTKSQTYKILQEESVKTDSIMMNLIYFLVPIGAVQGKNSPFVYEQWITKILYFESHSNANWFLKSIKSQLDSIPHRFEPFYKEKPKETEWIYSFNDDNSKEIQSRSVDLTFYREENRVEFAYRVIYYFDKCK